MVGLDLEARRVVHPVAAQTQDRLLLQAVRLAAVGSVGNGAVAGVALLDVGVEQDDRRARPDRGGQLVKLGADPDLAALQLDRQHGTQLGGPGGRIPGARLVDLPTLPVKLLP